MITEEQRKLVDQLHSGKLTVFKINELRSNARRYGNLNRSIDLAVAYEVYKQESKYEGVNKK